jgi:hypothetical protein
MLGKGTKAGRAARIDWIVAKMVADEWGDAARAEACALFGVSPLTLESDASEASRRIERALDDPQLKAMLDAVLHETLEELGAIGVSRDENAMVRVAAMRERRETVATWAQLRGIDAPKRVEIDGVLSALLSRGLSEIGEPKE